MEFDKSKVYTALNADELKLGSKVIVADTIDELKRYVEDYCDGFYGLSCTVDGIMPEYFSDRFLFSNHYYNLAYLVSEPKEKKLKWTDLKIGDVIRKGTLSYLVTGIHADPSTDEHIFVRNIWILDSQLENWEKVEE